MSFAEACFAVDCLVVDGWHAFEHKGEVRQTYVHMHPGITRQDMASPVFHDGERSITGSLSRPRFSRDGSLFEIFRVTNM